MRILELYGSSETGVIAVDGKPVAGVEVHVVATAAWPSDPGPRARCSSGAASMAVGYLHEEGGGRFPLRDGFYPTGDLGHLDARGNLVLEGRTSLRLNIAGVKVDPVEIERAILALPQVAQVAASSVIGDRGMEMIKASVVLRAGQDLRRETLIEHCRKELAEHKVPRIVEVVDSLPENIMGKRVRDT